MLRCSWKDHGDELVPPSKAQGEDKEFRDLELQDEAMVQLRDLEFQAEASLCGTLNPKIRWQAGKRPCNRRKVHGESSCLKPAE